MARKNGKLTYHQRIMNLLTDGAWHSLREIHKAVARFIDPETADVEYRRRHSNWEQDTARVRISAGKKRLIFLSLNTAIHHRKLVEARGRDWDREYRLTKEALRERHPSPDPVKEDAQ
jgi:hypothetical protein